MPAHTVAYCQPVLSHTIVEAPSSFAKHAPCRSLRPRTLCMTSLAHSMQNVTFFSAEHFKGTVCRRSPPGVTVSGLHSLAVSHSLTGTSKRSPLPVAGVEPVSAEVAKPMSTPLRHAAHVTHIQSVGGYPCAAPLTRGLPFLGRK